MDESVAYGAKIRATTQPFLLSFHSNAIRVSPNQHEASRSSLPLPTLSIKYYRSLPCHHTDFISPGTTCIREDARYLSEPRNGQYSD
jgi:hypothetical protein